jgi:hypothetical protein
MCGSRGWPYRALIRRGVARLPLAAVGRLEIRLDRYRRALAALDDRELAGRPSRWAAEGAASR